MTTRSDPEPTIDRIFEVVADTARDIRSILTDRRGALEGENPSGETQLAADVWADEHLVDRLGVLEGVGAVASEERSTPTRTGDGFAVAIDPLDGSSNLRSNNLMGTILGVYDASDLPAAGRDLVAAGYVLYGPTTTMVEATVEGVRELIIESSCHRVVDADVSIPADPTVYGFGGRVPEWSDPFRAFVRDIESELKLRYGGALVGDVNQVLAYGGIFSYPGLSSRPTGKLRLQFEGHPIGFIVEAAGGRSSDGTGSLLDRTPTDLHERTPVHVGSPSVIDRLEDALDS